MKHVGITGGAGFIGSYITKKFLDEGYKVRVSVTNLSKSHKYEHLFNLGNEDNLSIKELKVQNIDSLRSFCKDCDIVIHCGTPFKLGVENPKRDLYEPTIKGTENMLEIALENRGISKFVFVASVAAYNTAFPYPVASRDPDHLYTEEDEPHLDEAHIPYAQAKYYADQTVRKFIEKNPEINTEIVTVSPVTVMGSPLSGREDSTSVGLQRLFKSKEVNDPFMQTLFDDDVEFALVDVEDVAEGVYRAAATKGNHGKNYLFTSESWKISDISRMLNGEQPEGKPRTVYSNELAREDLGMEFKPVKDPLHKFDAD
ncbi:NAD-dependent epimerase/dehydratase family protein [Christiangramia sabulilitoris]|uniref:NAD-dependent epimerase/dehydratase family protein n=1 Tax=Christiangramia sabulilitoris TaxID=2583991 RepID=A0A550I7E9_9FLAO|nr:NAD-dependent epimerase/dehydratase family protein [Christiangramia sabulilitoris]TRO66748.1 NAD-dependent epimerase/dehydratase family protein [Christiangramia sabulilitoris]